uniref:putative RNA polymerase II subunit B1 CTD phosphatase RPAP2 isoform X3 n=1 Tax=Podarcis muralis TaxID=64176 RepID=UPI00109F6E90|nr:putative RNA polymerase II subunit B1 CTD phosphatase RPAP2 isoform X3 [Podarcis muralis]
MLWKNALSSSCVATPYAKRGYRMCQNKSTKYQPKQTKCMILLKERPPDIELLKDGESGHSGKEVKLVNEAINTLDIENPLPAVTQGDSSIDSESSSEAEQEFVSSVLQEKSVHPLPRKGILKEKCKQRAQPKPSNSDASVDDAAEQLSWCKLDTQGKEHVLDSSRIKGAPVSLSSPTVQLSEGFGDSSSGSQVVFLGMSPKGAELFKRLLAKSKQTAKPSSEGPANPLTAKCSLLEGLRQTFTEWRTEETVKLLHGSSAAATHAPQPSPAAGHEEEEELDEDDLESDNEPNKAASERGTQNPLSQPLPFKASSPAAKPVPSYEKLKEETSQLELKVQEFYRGNFTLGEEDLATLSRGEQHHSNDNGDHQRPPALPLVDSKAQQQIRTRIVLEKLRKVLPAVLGPLRIPLGDVYSELKDLVKTFRLTNTNIIHKTPVWTLIAIVLLSVLSQNIPVFASSQHSQGYSQFLATLLEELHFKNEDFESLTRIFRSESLPY